MSRRGFEYPQGVQGRQAIYHAMSFSYARGEKSSFVDKRCRPYIRCMKNRDFNIARVEELYALERAARRERSREQKGLRHA
jgi:hypothetical protein